MFIIKELEEIKKKEYVKQEKAKKKKQTETFA